MASAIDTRISGSSGAELLNGIRRDEKSKATENLKGPSFEQTLAQQMDAAAKGGAETAKVKSEKPILKFSNHALERMNTRGIHFTPEQVTKIEQGMQRAGEKGAKEALVLTDDSALIVSLKNNTVVTVMDKNMLKENVFTNIDSTVFV